MRLAAMTASQEDVDELSRTFKMTRPSTEEINRAAPQSLDKHSSTHKEVDLQSTRGGGLVLMAIITLILIGIIYVFLF